MLVVVRTANRRYAVRRTDLLGIRRADVARHEALRSAQPFASMALGALLEPLAASEIRPSQALLVSLRRRTIALLVERVEEFLEQPHVHPLPALLRNQLHQEWAVGILMHEDEPIIVLDLRAVARSVLLQRAGREHAETLVHAEIRDNNSEFAYAEPSLH
jgi:hypothetical protein